MKNLASVLAMAFLFVLIGIPALIIIVMFGYLVKGNN